MYADRETDAMRTAIRETDRRREIQLAYNREHGITPGDRPEGDLRDLATSWRWSRAPRPRGASAAATTGARSPSPEQLEKLIVELEEEMLAAAEELRFEEAARIRDELKELRRDLDAMRA